MDWLKDKKNQPIVAAILAVVILGAAVAMYFLYFGGGSSTPTASAPTDPNMSSEVPPADQSGMGATAPTDPSAAAGGTTPAQPTASKGAKAAPMEVWRSDPFLPPGYKPPKKGGVKLKPPIRDLPMFAVYRWDRPEKKNDKPDQPQPMRRMSGLIVNNRIYAIIETNGKTEIVQPGDRLSDGLASVDRIERDRVVLKTTDQKPKYLIVRLASSVRDTSANNINQGSGVSGGIPGQRSQRGRGAPAGQYEMMPM